MRTSSFPDFAVGVLVSHLFSMTPHTTPSSPTIPSPSRSEKLLRDALLRDERERRHQSSPPLPAKPLTHRRRHTHTPSSSYSASTKEDYACGSSLHTDVTIAQLSQQALRSPSGLRKSNTDNHSLASMESCSTGTSGSSVSHLHIGCASGYCAFHSSLDAVSAPPQPHFSVGHHPVQQSQPNSPRSPSTKHFNARKASTQCRAIEGYVSFASVEGLGEPPLVGDEFDGDGRGKRNSENERMRAVAFLPLGVLNAALRWKKLVGGAGPGISHGVEGKDQGVVV
jgi:hypothetical protein